MIRKLQYGCLVGSIGLIGADRVDLFAGRGPFVLTPFLVLAPVVVLVQLLRMVLRGNFRLTIIPPIRRQAPFLAVLGMFLLFSFSSIPFGLDPERGLVAYCDLLLVAGLGYCFSLRILADPDQEKLILRAVTFALIVYVVFCIGECIAWAHGVILDPLERSGSWLDSTFAVGTFYWVPRLSGFTVDANRAGFVLVMYLVLLDRFVAKSRYTVFLQVAIAFLILPTLSRSAMLCWLTYYVFTGSFWKRLVLRRAIVALVAIAAVSSLLYVVYKNEIDTLVQAWKISDVISARLSVDAGSSGSDHIILIQRGVKTWLRSPKTIVTGIGFAAAPKVLQDFFGYDNGKYGNFHSLYVTVLAEMGLPAFIVLLVLLVYPFIARKGTMPCIAAIMIFNVSYQSHLEPAFWLLLALAWSYPSRNYGLAKGLDLEPATP